MTRPSHGSTLSPLRVLGIACLVALGSLALAGGKASGGPEPAPVLGDVDCDGSLTSIDAVLILQYNAGLLDALPCPGNGDTSGDGVTNSLDAGLVLQHTAGLVSDFVTFGLAVHRPEGFCDQTTTPVKCDIPVGSEFGVSVLAGHPPPDGYVGMQVFLAYDDLRYNPAALVSEEVVWPDAGLTLRSDPDEGLTGTEGFVSFGLLSNAVPPFGISTHHGTMIEVSMTCPPDSGVHSLALVSELPRGASFVFGTHFQTALPFPRDRALPVPVDQRIAEPEWLPFGAGERFVGIAAELEINCVDAAS